MFNEKKEEWSAKQGKNIPVWQTPKYIESRVKALEIIDSKVYGLEEADFWILMNETKNGQMAYTGLILSHNGCLKINDKLPAEQKFRPSCVTLDKEGYGGSLVYSYCCEEQGIYEVGEVNGKNCRIDYPYAMAFKRMMDRVVLKASKLAYSGIYSEVEADEFRERLNAQEEGNDTPAAKPVQNNENPSVTPPPGSPEFKEPEKFVCQKCGKVLTPYIGANGTEISIRRHAAGSEKKFGQVLCLDCINQFYPDAMK